MDTNQVRKCVDAIEALGRLDSIKVTLTAGYSYYNNEGSRIAFDHSSELMKVMRLNSDPTRHTTGQDPIQVIFVDYGDINVIECLVDTNTAANKVDFDIPEDDVKAICKQASLEQRPTYGQTSKDWAEKDDNGKITSYVKKDSNGNPIYPYDIPNVPMV